MKKLLFTILSTCICFTVGQSAALADHLDSKLSVQSEVASSSQLVSEDQEHSEALLVSALFQMAWKYTYKDRFNSFTESVASGMTSSNVAKVVPVEIEVESSVYNTTLNLVYRF